MSIPRDDNGVTVLAGVSSADGVTLIPIQADPDTGAILADLSGGVALDDLTDVDVATPSDGQVLTWVDANSAWEAVTPSSVDLSDINEDVKIRSDHSINWSNSTANTTTLDLGIGRSARGYIYIGDPTDTTVLPVGINFISRLGGANQTTTLAYVPAQGRLELSGTHPSLYSNGGSFTTGTISPAAANTYDLGSTAAEWRSLYIATSILLGTGQDVGLERDSAGVLEVTDGSTGTGDLICNDLTINTALTGVLRADSGVISTDSDVTDLVSAASLTLAGKVELATTAEIDTGTDSTRAMPVDQFVASKRNVRHIQVVVLAAATATVGDDTTSLFEIESTIAGTITSVGAYNATAGTTGTATYDIHLNGTTIMTTTKISIETGEKSSRDATTQPVLTTTSIAVGDLLTFYCDTAQSGTPANGLTFFIYIRE